MTIQRELYVILRLLREHGALSRKRLVQQRERKRTHAYDQALSRGLLKGWIHNVYADNCRTLYGLTVEGRLALDAATAREAKPPPTETSSSSSREKAAN